MLDGAFGSGKTSVAKALYKKIHKTVIFDPERIGELIWETIPYKYRFCHENTGNFQDMEMWCEQSVAFIKSIINHYDVNVLIPMTILNYNDLLYFKNELCEYNLQHFCLYASKDTIIRRLEERNEHNDWPYLQIDKCISAFDNNDYGHYIYTDRMSINEICNDILNRLGALS